MYCVNEVNSRFMLRPYYVHTDLSTPLLSAYCYHKDHTTCLSISTVFLPCCTSSYYNRPFFFQFFYYYYYFFFVDIVGTWTDVIGFKRVSVPLNLCKRKIYKRLSVVYATVFSACGTAKFRSTFRSVRNLILLL